MGVLREHTGPTPQIELAYEAEIKTLWLTLAPEPRPVFTFELLASVSKVQKTVHALWGPALYAKSPIRFLAYLHKQIGPISTLGGDIEFYLDCIAKGDRPRLEDYARLSVEGIIWNDSCLRGAAITIAAAPRGVVLGGGIDAPRSCNVMIAERQASFSYPEIKFNHFPIGAVAVLSRYVEPRVARQILTGGKEYSAEDFARIGVLDGVVGPGESDAWVRKFIAENLKTHAAQLAIFQAFSTRVGRLFEDELHDLARRWTDHMMHLTPTELAHLQKIVLAQDVFLSRTFRELERAKRKAEASPEETRA
ncbi:MAG TPA: crotonase/enoyl-CoA hydratase family protein [Rhodoblastus sp.]|nr:crotonase/enoyl-CoA hydratase family protein [Rhodoblastus sp.]